MYIHFQLESNFVIQNEVKPNEESLIFLLITDLQIYFLQIVEI